MPRLNLPCVSHPNFGTGYILGQRFLDVGQVMDVFFLDGVVRTLQTGFLEVATPTDMPKTLRAAYSNYKRLHRIKASPKADVVPDVPVDLDEDSWRKSPNEFPGDEDSLEEATASQ